jgi:hypothetical protein
MTESPFERVRGRLGELGVAQIQVDRDGIPFRDYSPDRIDVRALTTDVVELWDRDGRSWVGSPERVLRALAGIEWTDDPGDVWLRLARAH